MAAGRGMRMVPLTNTIPKPLAPYGNATLIADRIQAVTKAVDFVHITVGYKAAAVAQHVMELGVNSVFNTEGRGNSWWIFNTFLKLLDEPIFVLTCDNIVDLDFQAIGRDYMNLGRPPCLVVPARPVPGLEGDYIFRDGNIVTKLDRSSPSNEYCSGIQVLNPALLNHLITPTDSFSSVWEQLIRKKMLYCSSVFPRKWFAADTLKQLKTLNATRQRPNNP